MAVVLSKVVVLLLGVNRSVFLSEEDSRLKILSRKGQVTIAPRLIAGFDASKSSQVPHGTVEKQR